ncbi:MAG: CDP-alcohol phosphatidyltransferase family protein, partial [Ilumatobacteraceae bacterium]
MQQQVARGRMVATRISLCVQAVAGWGVGYVAQAVVGMATAVWLVARSYCRDDAARAHFGSANRITLARLAAAMLLVAVVAELPIDADGAVGQTWLPWALVAVTAVVAVLDAVDGPLARRSGMASAFGARFDMETDA